MKNKKLSRLVIPVISILIIGLVCISCHSVQKKTITGNNEAATTAADKQIPYVMVDEMPIFPGGDTALLSYIAKNARYPEGPKNKKIEGKVILRFCVNADGSVSKVTILKSVDPDLDGEAKRVVETFPRFIPGKEGGKAVPVWYMVPVTFALR